MDARNETQGLLALTLAVAFLAFCIHLSTPFEAGVLMGDATSFFLAILVLAIFAIVNSNASRKTSRIWSLIGIGWLFWVASEIAWLALAAGAQLPWWLAHAFRLPFYFLIIKGLWDGKQAFNFVGTSTAKFKAFVLVVLLGAFSFNALQGAADSLTMAYYALNVLMVGAGFYAALWSCESTCEEKPFKWLGLGFACIVGYELMHGVATSSGSYESVYYIIDLLRFLGFAFLALGAEKQAKLDEA